MEWLRSCYVSQWNLFKGGQTLTQGRYVFCPPATPHYPGLHPYGSRNWTRGEVDTSPALGENIFNKQVYDKGGLTGAANVPPVLVGSADCIEGGDDPNTLPTSVQLIEGYNIACFTPGQLTLEIPQPVLWYRPDEIAFLAQGQIIKTWQDHSDYRRDMFEFFVNGREMTVVPSTFGSMNAGRSFAETIYSFLPRVALTGDFCVVVVAFYHWPGFLATPVVWLPAPLEPPLIYPLSHYLGFCAFSDGVEGGQRVELPQNDSTFINSSRRVGTQVILRTFFGPQAPIQLTAVRPVNCGLVALGPFSFPQSASVDLLELRVYDRTLSQAQETAIYLELRQRYFGF